jgi:3-hydroxybutyryl-CoA dehydrogenase
MQTVYRICGIVGTGAMGRGIAQMAAQAGSEVILYDAQEGAARKACEALTATWQSWPKRQAGCSHGAGLH